eukprot:4480758-Alexandrium_andersonii.AAC.1
MRKHHTTARTSAKHDCSCPVTHNSARHGKHEWRGLNCMTILPRAKCCRPTPSNMEWTANARRQRNRTDA